MNTLNYNKHIFSINFIAILIITLAFLNPYVKAEIASEVNSEICSFTWHYVWHHPEKPSKDTLQCISAYLSTLNNAQLDRLNSLLVSPGMSNHQKANEIRSILAPNCMCVTIVDSSGKTYPCVINIRQFSSYKWHVNDYVRLNSREKNVRDRKYFEIPWKDVSEINCKGWNVTVVKRDRSCTLAQWSGSTEIINLATSKEVGGVRRILMGSLALTICNKCTSILDGDWRFCPYCGTSRLGDTAFDRISTPLYLDSSRSVTSESQLKKKSLDKASLAVVVTTPLVGVYSLSKNDLVLSLDGPVHQEQKKSSVNTATANTFTFKHIPEGIYILRAKYGKKKLEKSVSVQGHTMEVQMVFK